MQAVKQFQTRNGLNATGVVDEATSLALGLTTNPLYGLKQGATGDAVRQLQQRLIELGITVTGGADGVFGPGTTAAVKQFQGRVGYSKSGVVNAATAVALGAASTPAATPAPVDRSDGNPSSSSALKVGARGDAVKQLQQQLIAAGFSMVGGADGMFGALTANALGAFQQSAGLEATRVADDADGERARPAGGGQRRLGNPSPSSPLLGLKVGARSDAVKQLQQALINAGVAVKGGADGVVRGEHAGRAEAVPAGARTQRLRRGRRRDRRARIAARTHRDGRSLWAGRAQVGLARRHGEVVAGGVDQGRRQRPRRRRRDLRSGHRTGVEVVPAVARNQPERRRRRRHARRAPEPQGTDVADQQRRRRLRRVRREGDASASSSRRRSSTPASPCAAVSTATSAPAPRRR